MENRSTGIIITAIILFALGAGCLGAQSPPPPGSVNGSRVNITVAERTYPAYLAVPSASGRYPAVLLIHSFNGLEPGYYNLSDQLASEGYVVLAPEWQTFNQQAGDSEVGEIINSSLALLSTHNTVDPTRIGLTGFCAGGRYTMLFLPQRNEFRSGVAWYGFPYSRGFTNDTMPAEHIDTLTVPLLMIHGSRDQASPVTDIYRYAEELENADTYFELKVYQGKGHGFMIENGSLVRDDIAQDAFREMSTFFNRTLK
ncbi:MAG: dienelactone hydrolase family protein [Methanomicrobiales archaeon]|nr:dienelactone hydrolase family protein [Methanomicrobiales archaeon]